ncbi:MAG: serine/threonine-protein kinase, partial [Actinobacteria bacterium]|nr:serine/threonine-protein kinase [Actinomycetota bacterium]
MRLEPGTTLGHYEVVSSLGAGGMGEVYRAKDTKLGREVAIKLLLEEVSQDTERRARFEREAKVLASLNHTNIASLHAFERDGDTNFLVMELVEGETLADRIKRGAIPVDEALPLFLQIAEGLEAAHEKGIIHRDLKPANIKVSEDGNVKILDFGLAKAMAYEGESDTDPSESPTITAAGYDRTRQGQILGTAAYMSPEQAKGKTVDKRADIWAFG